MTSVPEFFSFFVSVELDSFRKYVQTVDSALRHQFQEFDRNVNEQIKLLSDEAADQYEDFVENGTYELACRFPTMAMQAAFLSLCSFTTNELIQLGRHLRDGDERILLKPEDVKGSGIIQARKYLDEVCGVAFPRQSASWKEIVRYMRLRKLIVNYRGIILPRQRWNAPDAAAHTRLSRTLRPYAKSKNLIAIEGVEVIRISRPFCLEAIATVRTFFNELLEALD